MLKIRDANANDIPLVLQFIRDLAEYEKAPEQAVATAEDMRRDGFTGNPKFRVLTQVRHREMLFSFFRASVIR
jgi:hypothetical protein